MNKQPCAYAKSCSTLCDPGTLCNPTNCSLPGPLSKGFPRQEYWTGLPLPPPGYLPNPGIEPRSPVAPELGNRFFTTERLGEL